MPRHLLALGLLLSACGGADVGAFGSANGAGGSAAVGDSSAHAGGEGGDLIRIATASVAASTTTVGAAATATSVSASSGSTGGEPGTGGAGGADSGGAGGGPFVCSPVGCEVDAIGCDPACNFEGQDAVCNDAVCDPTSNTLPPLALGTYRFKVPALDEANPTCVEECGDDVWWGLRVYVQGPSCVAAYGPPGTSVAIGDGICANGSETCAVGVIGDANPIVSLSVSQMAPRTGLVFTINVLPEGDCNNGGLEDACALAGCNGVGG